MHAAIPLDRGLRSFGTSCAGCNAGSGDQPLLWTSNCVAPVIVVCHDARNADVEERETSSNEPRVDRPPEQKESEARKRRTMLRWPDHALSHSKNGKPEMTGAWDPRPSLFHIVNQVWVMIFQSLMPSITVFNRSS